MEGKTNSAFTLQDEENPNSQELRSTHSSENTENNSDEHRIGIDESTGSTRQRRNIPSSSSSAKLEEELTEIIPSQGNGSGPLQINNEEIRIDTSSGSKNRILFWKIFHIACIVLLNTLILAYLITAIVFWTNQGDCELDWCDGLGMLVIILALVYFGIIYYILKRYFGKLVYKQVLRPISTTWNHYMENKIISIIVYLIPLAAALIYIGVDTIGSSERLISGLGMIVLLGLGFLFSKNPRKIRWRPVAWGLGLQFLLGLLTIRWSVGRNIFQCIGDKVATFLAYADEGSSFVYGDWLIQQNTFAFKSLSVIFFLSFMVQILYYYGAMQFIVVKLGWLLQSLLGTTVCESVNASASIFLGMSESPLLIKPYLKDLTKSEIHAVMTGGFATVAGTVMAAYISFGVSPSHLIVASVMSAPAALCYSKLFYPETEESKNRSEDVIIEKGDETSVLDAATKGALMAIQLVLGIIANIIAFVSFVAFLNGFISWLGTLVGVDELTFEYILSKVFIPLAWLMGVDFDECEAVARLIGLKTIVNEFVAYEQLGKLKEANGISPRAEMIATYALCGFSNPGSIGILIGALVTMAPNQRSAVTEVAMRAFISGSATCFLTACIAGLLMPSDYYSSLAGSSSVMPVFNATL